MGELLSKVVPLGIGAAFTPSLLALQILVVSGDPWRRRSLAVAVGAGSAFGLVGLLALLGFARVARASLLAFVIMPFLLSIKDVSSFAMLIPALHDISVSPANAVDRLIAILVLYVLALFGVLSPPAARLVLGHRVDPPLQAIYRFTMDNQFRIVGVVALIMTIYLVATGLTALN